MSRKTKYNPERRDWKGKSYKKVGVLVQDIKDKVIPPTSYILDLYYRDAMLKAPESK